MTNMYEDVERSIWMNVAREQEKMGTNFLVYNNLVTKKDFPVNSGALSIMKNSDTPNFQNGGGCQANIHTSLRGDNGQDMVHSLEPWPQFYNLLYQFVTLADNLPAARQIDLLIRRSLRPRQGLLLYDSNLGVWTTQRLDTEFAGYINRDVVQDFKFWRVTLIRVEVPDYIHEDAVSYPAITQIQADVDLISTDAPDELESLFIMGQATAVLSAVVEAESSVTASLPS